MANPTPIVFPSAGSDITTVHSDFSHEAECVKAVGGHIIIVDLEHLALIGDLRGTGIMDANMASDYDNVEIMVEDIDRWVKFGEMEPVAYDQYCFYRLPESISADFYQLLRWKLGVRLVEAVMNTADFSRVKSFPRWNSRIADLMDVKNATPVQRQWWLNGEIVFASSLSADVFPMDEASFTVLRDAVMSLSNKLVAVDVSRTEDGHWGIANVLEAQTTPLPQGCDLSDLFSALTRYGSSR